MFSHSSIQHQAGRFWQRIFRTRPEDTLPHVITHHRVYIVPTKRGFAFLLALLLMLIASVNYGLSLGYALCFVLTGLFAATLLHTYRNLAGIRVEQLKPFNAFAGDEASFTISLTNASKETRHGIRLSTREGSQLMTPMDSERTTEAILKVPAPERGVLPLGRVTIQSDWPLGLWTCWSYLHTPIRTLVFPKPEIDAPPMPTSTVQDNGGSSAPSMEGDVSGLRQYRPGDSIGSIAWKSAAKGMGIQVRTFDSKHSPTHAILVWTKPDTETSRSSSPDYVRGSCKRRPSRQNFQCNYQTKRLHPIAVKNIVDTLWKFWLFTVLNYDKCCQKMASIATHN